MLIFRFGFLKFKCLKLNRLYHIILLHSPICSKKAYKMGILCESELPELDFKMVINAISVRHNSLRET